MASLIRHFYRFLLLRVQLFGKRGEALVDQREKIEGLTSAMRPLAWLAAR